jgi:hypothetical protein
MTGRGHPELASEAGRASLLALMGSCLRRQLAVPAHYPTVEAVVVGIDLGHMRTLCGRSPTPPLSG